jgi:hypothetical protein
LDGAQIGGNDVSWAHLPRNRSKALVGLINLIMTSGTIKYGNRSGKAPRKYVGSIQLLIGLAGPRAAEYILDMRDWRVQTFRPLHDDE